MQHQEYDTEVVTLALALLFIYARLGRRRGRTTAPRPASALAVLRGIRRAHARLGKQMADLSLATRLADALNNEYLEEHGGEALQVQRVEPLTSKLIVDIINTIVQNGLAFAFRSIIVTVVVAWRVLNLDVRITEVLSFTSQGGDIESPFFFRVWT